MNNADLALYAVPAFIAMMVVEWWDARRDPDRAPSGRYGREAATNWATYAIGQLTKPLLQYVLPFSTIVLAASWTPLHLSPRDWWVWLLGLVVTDSATTGRIGPIIESGCCGRLIRCTTPAPTSISRPRSGCPGSTRSPR